MTKEELDLAYQLAEWGSCGEPITLNLGLREQGHLVVGHKYIIQELLKEREDLLSQVQEAYLGDDW